MHVEATLNFFVSMLMLIQLSFIFYLMEKVICTNVLYATVHVQSVLGRFLLWNHINIMTSLKEHQNSLEYIVSVVI